MIYVIKLVKPPVELKKKVFSLKQKRLPNFSKGIKAEEIATTFLINKGCLLLEKNIRLGNFEIDLVVLDQKFDEIVFVEVKYRKEEEYGDPSQAVDQKKINKMISVAKSYLRKKQFKKDYRFDIISVSGDLKEPEIEHFENVTWL
ncbi:MAG TPA: YraN family protein [Candidatus Pacebacteria bacterium]|nr:YraN family protein [Candidatus Paceibacterota bacterium]